jgi:hypothetical protein
MKSLQKKRFQKKIENFTCGHCGEKVEGNGFTNHCPNCLWSKHVDVNPGDRKARCRGLMEPIEIQIKSERCTILHRCVKCGFERRQRSSVNDSFDAIVRLSAQPRKVLING